jgi:hypothetical protein
MICSDAVVSEFDEHLSRYYQAAMTSLGNAKQCLKADQRSWIARVRDQCKDRDCLERVYLTRLAELDGLQPGMATIKNISLPHGPQLVGILAPAEDQVAAPLNPKAQVIELRGRIVDDVSGGDGYLLRTEQQRNYLLRPLMFIEGTDADMLASAARERQSTFLVRGYVDNNETPPAIDVSRCAYIYRLP